MKQLLILPMLLVILCSTSFCQEKKESLTNENVVALFKAGLPKSVIVTTIQNSNSKFDVSTTAIIDLKKQGLPDDLIEAIVNKGKTPAPGTSSPGDTTTPDSKLSGLEPGIYYADDAASKQTQLEASVFSQAKSGSIFLTAVSYGIAKTKSKAVLSGVQANLQISGPNPVFYFIFPHKSGGSGIGNEASSTGWYSNATSPNEFILVRFKIEKKSREIITGSFGTYSGFSSGIDDENKVSYRFTKLSPGVYKVYFEFPLSAGEYAFMFAGGATTGISATGVGGVPSQKAFDFSVTK